MILKEGCKKWSDEQIPVPTGTEYITKDWMEKIPENCVFNKGVTGCGATTYAIENNGHTIIAMPYVSLIKNKEKQHGDKVIGVYEGVDENDILNYTSSHGAHKILVTFDSLPRLIQTMNKSGLNVYSNYFLLIDEWQVLFNSYKFRYDAIRALLDEAKRFERVTYMTATPIENRYFLEELKHLPIIELKWESAVRPTTQLYQVDKPIDFVATVCKEHKAQKEDFNYHFFVNSVDFISKVLRKANLSPESVKVVCSQSRESGKKNQTKLGVEYKIAQPLDPVRQFNFYTSTCFEGCDIYDEKGLTFIINYGKVPHTLIDIGTLFIQIAGRIRNSEYKNHIIQIFSKAKATNDVSLEEYIKASEADYNKAIEFAERINRNNQRDDIKELYSKKKYIRTEDGRLVVDRNLVNSDIVSFKLKNHLYSSRINVRRALWESHIAVEDKGFLSVETIKPLYANPRMSFRELFERYCQLKTTTNNFSFGRNPEIEIIENNNPLVKESYQKLGRDTVERLNYIVTNIKRELAKKLDTPEIGKIIMCLKEELEYNKAIPNARIKELLQEIYNFLGVRRKAKATDLEEWYEIKKTTPKINGKSTACMTIVREKTVVYWKVKQQKLFNEDEPESI